MMNVEPFLIFNGNCEEAFTFYESVFGVKKMQLMRYSEIPESDKKHVPKEDMNRVVYVGLPVSKTTVLMGCDSQSNMPATFGDNVSLTINLESRQEAEHTFKKLSEGGKIIMPLGKTFFADLYAMFTDKFGINWMVMYMSAEKK